MNGQGRDLLFDTSVCIIKLLNFGYQIPFFSSLTVKLSKFNHLPNRTELNTSSSRRTALKLFDYFGVFFCIKFGLVLHRTELQNELNMMHSGDEDTELCSVDRFGSVRSNRTEPNFLQQKTQK